jgi:hypothetical protein
MTLTTIACVMIDDVATASRLGIVQCIHDAAELSVTSLSSSPELSYYHRSTCTRQTSIRCLHIILYINASVRSLIPPSENT